jgi:asparagine synthase (glutamine-hydrolysing)
VHGFSSRVPGAGWDPQATGAQVTAEPPVGGEPHAAGRYQIWFAGYLANRDELAAGVRDGTGADGPPSDAAVFALAYQRWGGALARHVLGEYAAAVLDSVTGTVTLAHDEFGLVPVYYAVADGALHFATGLGDLVRGAGVGTLNERHLTSLLAFGTAPPGSTPYEHIRRLLPGEYVTWRAPALTRHQETLPRSVAPVRYRDAREYDEHFRDVLTAGIAAAMPQGATVWCELSGGLDSSTVLSIAAGPLGRPVSALSSVYPKSRQADEGRWIRAVLRQYPVPWHAVDGDATPPFGELPSGFVAEPDAQLILRPAAERQLRDLLSEHGVDVVLTGQGGDSVLLGGSPGPWFFADLLRRGRMRRLWQLCQAWSAASADQRSPSYWLLRFGLRGALHPELTRAPGSNGTAAGWLSPDVAATAAPPWPPFPSVQARTPVADALYLSDILGLADLVAGGGRAEATGVAFRNPLLYRPLADFMRAVPGELKMSPERDRHIQRRALDGILPAKTIARRDKGAPGQAYYQSLAASREWQERLTERPLIAERGYVDLQRWRAAVRDACLGRTDSFRHFLTAACIEIWLQQLATLRPDSARV